MQLTPTIAIHMSAALSAVVLGPIALWARLGETPHPRVHRAAGYAWISMMLASALSALFIHDSALPNLAGYTPIHALIPITLAGMAFAFWAIIKQKYTAHHKAMQTLYWMGCVIPGMFTLLPNRLLGRLLWGL